MIHLLAQVFLALKVLNTESIISQGLNFESQLVIALNLNFFWIESQPISQSWILKSISGDANNGARCYIRYLGAPIWLWSLVKYLTIQWVYCRGTVLNAMDNSSARGIVKLTIAAAANNAAYGHPTNHIYSLTSRVKIRQALKHAPFEQAHMVLFLHQKWRQFVPGKWRLTRNSEGGRNSR